MSLGNLNNEGDLRRWLEQQLQVLGLLPNNPLTGLFLSLAVGGEDRVLAFGKSELSFPGSSEESSALEVTHGLKRRGEDIAPLVVVATDAETSFGHRYNIGAYSYTTTKFTLRAFDVAGGKPSGGSKTPAAWVAIG